MNWGLRRPGPALIVAIVALLAALGGTVYAAEKIDGASIKVASLPGNRVTPGSLQANRLMAGTIPGNKLAPGSITGTQIDTATLGQVPSAAHADSADSAHDAETALNAVNAVTATSVNGHAAGCKPATRPFAGACWQTVSNEAALTATAAAASCANQGGTLPEALQLVAFSKQPGIALADGDEWTGDVTNASGEDLYGVVTVSTSGVVRSDISTASHHFRCVIPLVS
jgi:hypothetical protein